VLLVLPPASPEPLPALIAALTVQLLCLLQCTLGVSDPAATAAAAHPHRLRRYRVLIEVLPLPLLPLPRALPNTAARLPPGLPPPVRITLVEQCFGVGRRDHIKPGAGGPVRASCFSRVLQRPQARQCHTPFRHLAVTDSLAFVPLPFSPAAAFDSWLECPGGIAAAPGPAILRARLDLFTPAGSIVCFSKKFVECHMDDRCFMLVLATSWITILASLSQKLVESHVDDRCFMLALATCWAEIVPR